MTGQGRARSRPRQTPAKTYAPTIRLPDWAEEKARKITRFSGWDYYVLRGNWLSFAQTESAKSNPPESVGAAFLVWVSKQERLR